MAATNRYVDYTNGSDAYDGTVPVYTSGTIGPWKTTQHAAQNSNPNAGGAGLLAPMTVWFRAGDVEETITGEIQPAYTGNNENERLIFKVDRYGAIWGDNASEFILNSGTQGVVIRVSTGVNYLTLDGFTIRPRGYGIYSGLATQQDNYLIIENCVFRNNTLAGNSVYTIGPYGNNCILRNNIIKNIDTSGGAGTALFRGFDLSTTKMAHVYNNTVYNIKSGNDSPNGCCGFFIQHYDTQGSNNIAHIIFKNNIVQKSAGTATNGFLITIRNPNGDGLTLLDLISDNNCLCKDGADEVAHDYYNNVDYNTLAAWKTWTQGFANGEQDGNSIDTDAQFEGTGDSRADSELKNSSPCINAGVVVWGEDGSKTPITPISVMPNLVAYWKMDESSWNGTTGEVVDSSGNNHHGVAVGGAITTTGIFNNCGIFNKGATQYANCGNFDPSGQSLTWMVWINSDGWAGSEGGIIAKDSPTNRCWYLRASGANPYTIDVGIIATGVATPNSGNILDVGTWYHIAVTYNGTNSILYVNGVEVDSSSAASGNIVTGAAPVTIGMHYTTVYTFDGKIDDAVILDTVLIEQQIKEIYNLGRGNLPLKDIYGKQRSYGSNTIGAIEKRSSRIIL